MSTTFTVNDTLAVNERYAQYLRKDIQPWKDHWEVKKKIEGETAFASDRPTIGGSSPLFHAAGLAFNSHLPWVISPDSVWLTILTGLVHHIDTDHEALRHHFVQHEGKPQLTVIVNTPQRPSLADYSGDVWMRGIQGFSEQLHDHIGKKHDLIVCNFSTTTEIDRISSEVALMGAMKHWFQYKMIMCCGLTRVTLEGTPEDWGNIVDRFRALTEFCPTWWTSQLLPVLEQFRRAAEGSPDRDFWKAMYLSTGVGSGSQSNVTGWINTFFPYIAGKEAGTMQPNTKYIDWQNAKGEGVSDEDFPMGLMSAPVLLDDHGTKYNCKFYGGLVGVTLGDDNSVKAESGWAIQNLGRV